MPVTQEKVNALLTPLTAVRPITSRKMFGGIGIYCDGIFFAVIDDDRLFFKVDDITLPDYERFNAEQWFIPGEPPSPQPYREVPSSVLSDPNQIAPWIDAAVGVATRKKAKKPKK
jgi:DNA transformation protein